MAQKMNDPAHELTEQELAKAEKRIAGIYRGADSQLAKLIQSLMQELEPDLDDWEKVVEEGTKTAQQFQQWKMDRLMRSKRAKVLIQKISRLMVSINQKSADSAKTALDAVFALNANYALFEYEEMIDGD